MLFNSYIFIFCFLPIVLAGFFFLKPAYRMGFFVFSSLLFYGQWNTVHLILLLISVSLNFIIAKRFLQVRRKRLLLSIGIILNLLPLVYFKYSYFLHLSTQSLVLPLAISFYTFQQIAFQVDLYREKIKSGTFGEYLFFVLFFPQLIAGPIVHYRHIMSQVHTGALQSAKWHYIQTGTVLFSMGLFKKVVLADQFFPLANRAFEHIDTLASAEAWTGLFAYSFGIYFDFSGYTDMALGLALFFGIKLPINFDSPYKAVNIVDFWRRWHITLSHFLRDHIYIPLGGNRKGEYRQIFNLLITMTLGGIWHGAGWTFMVWGLLHGVLLAMIHLREKHLPRWEIPKSLAVVVTFVTVTLLWLLFRAENMSEAWRYYQVLFDFSLVQWKTDMFSWIAMGLAIVWFLPNSMVFTDYPDMLKTGRFYAATAAILFFIALKMMAEAPAQSFVYFNF